AACALRAPKEHAVLSFAGTVEVIRPLVSDMTPAVVAGQLLRMRGHGVTRLAAALKAAGEPLAPARARRRAVILPSDRATTDEHELDVVGTERVEQPPASAEQDRHEVDLHLVELPGPQQRLRRTGPVYHHGTIACRRPGLPGAGLDVGDEPRAARRDVSLLDP